MSAWVVSSEHVDVLVRLAIAGPSDGIPSVLRLDFPVRVQDDSGRWRKVAPVDDLRHSDLIDPSEIGEVLLSENRRSVAHRYSEPDEDVEPYVYTDPGFAPTCAEAARTLSCLAYQSCEHPDWEESFARRIVLRLQDAVLGALPGIDEAPWGWSATDIAKRRRTGATR